MKIKKYKTQTYYNGVKVYRTLHRTKQEALNYEKWGKDAEYDGEIVIDVFCVGCDKSLDLDDAYIKVGDDRYCSGCYEESSVTYYTVGGEYVGNENDVDEYDSPDEEGECEAKWNNN